MKVSIQNFRGIKRGELDLSRIALVAGVNAAGKSSVAQAVAAALSGQLMPFEGLRKSDAGMLVHSGTGKGSIRIEAPTGSIDVDYPQARLKTEGTPPAASIYALGIRSLVDLPQKEAAAVLLDYLKATPSEADTRTAAIALGLEDVKQQDKLWQRVVELGWDGAHAAAKETGAKMKGQWEHVTGERYGSAKSENWTPKHWEPGLETASEESLQAEQTQAREFLEAAIATTAVSADQREQWKAKAAELETIPARIAAAKERTASLEKDCAALLVRITQSPKPSDEEVGYVCPHCRRSVVVKGTELVKFEPVDLEENRRRAAALAEFRKQHKELTERMRAGFLEGSGLTTDLMAAEAAAKSLAAVSDDAGDADGVERAREGVRLAELRLGAFKSRREAQRLHQGVTINAAIQAMLASDGLRLAKLRGAVRDFNGQLRALCETAGWGAVEFGDDLAVSYADKPLVLLSASERFRAAVIVQIAMATIDRSAAVVIDAADILDRAGRNGLMRLLFSRAHPALVCMTMATAADVPRLEQRGTGYWVENGVVNASA